MERIKIFLRLKAREIGKFLRIVLMGLVMVLLTIIAIACFFGTVGFIVYFAIGKPAHLFEVVSMMVTVTILSCFGAIGAKRWIQSNWKLAGIMAEEAKMRRKTTDRVEG